MINTVIFDLDGTVLNTIDDLADATNHALQSFGMPAHTVDEVRSFVGNGIRKLIERAVPEETEEALTDQVFRSFRDYYSEHSMDRTCLYDGIYELVSRLHEDGYTIAVVSNKIDKEVKKLISHYFGELVDIAVGEMDGCRRKPAPDLVEFALRKLEKSPSEAIYVGDSDVDILTAQNASMACISVLWGFRDRTFLLENGAGLIAEKPEDIYSVLTGLNAIF